MNCKPGDLAVIVRAVIHPENIGAIVHVVRRVVAGEQVGQYVLTGSGGQSWFVSSRGRPLLWKLDSGETVYVAERFIGDEFLRPIRDQDGEDETLTWAGKPSDIKTPEAA